VYSLAAVGALDTPNPNSIDSDVTSAAHYALARKLAAASCVLLQNKDGILPLSNRTRIALLGYAGNDGNIFGGSGSGRVVPKKVTSMWDALQPACATNGQQCTYDAGADPQRAARAAAAADVAIVVIWATSSEGRDRADLNMNQTDLVGVVAAVQPNTVVVSVSPGPYLTPWAPAVKASSFFVETIDVGRTSMPRCGCDRGRGCGWLQLQP